MTKSYTLVEIAAALETDAKTLRRWIEREGWNTDPKKGKIDAGTSKYDKRIRTLTEDQVQVLANAHSKLWPPRPKSQAQAEAQATGLTGAVGLLREQVDDLKADHIGNVQFTSTITPLKDQLDDLERKYTTTLGQLTNALLAIKELQDWKATQESKPKSSRKPKTTDNPDHPAE